MASAKCWICGEQVFRFFKRVGLEVNECRGCGHFTADHQVLQEPPKEYHLVYEQTQFLTSLRSTRRRQAADILARLQRHGADRNILDYGCGRGAFLDECWATGRRDVAGADTSALAVSELLARGIPATQLPEYVELVSNFAELPFQPTTVTFLDVIEHLSGDLVGVFNSWLSRLTPATRYIVLKVPVQDGLLFRMARLLRWIGLGGPMRQLFQVGTWPPHFHYFCDRSFTAFLGRLKLDIVESWVDPDFEPDQLRARISSLNLVPNKIVRPIASWLYARAVRTGRADSRIVVLRRP
jgi:SAM-dependent methyltransferase